MANLPKPEPQREIATIANGRDITRGFTSSILQPTDTILLGRGGGDYSIYKEVLRDDQVAPCFQQRRLAVTSREWAVKPGGNKRIDKNAAAWLTEQLHHVGWDAVTEKMLYGVFYGFAAAELIYMRDGATIALDAIRVRDRSRFRFDAHGGLRLITPEHPMDGEPADAPYFWAFANGADNDDEPYGMGLAHWLYWPVLFKRNGLKFWLIFLEKFGMPTAKGTYDSGASPSERTKLLDALAAIQTDSGIIIPRGMEIELIEAARSGTVDYAKLHELMNAAVAKVILGQTMTTDQGSSRSQAEVHMDVRQDLVKADADLINESFNLGPVCWLMNWNFPGAAPPRVWRDLEDQEDLNARAERDERLSKVGYKPTLQGVKSAYGDEYEAADPAPAQPVPAAAPTFAQGTDPQDFASVAADKVEQDVAAHTDLDIEALRDIIDRADSLQDALAALDNALSAVPLDGRAALIQRALAASELAGRFDVMNGF